jgi:hypothetical protein
MDTYRDVRAEWERQLPKELSTFFITTAKEMLPLVEGTFRNKETRKEVVEATTSILHVLLNDMMDLNRTPQQSDRNAKRFLNATTQITTARLGGVPVEGRSESTLTMNDFYSTKHQPGPLDAETWGTALKTIGEAEKQITAAGTLAPPPYMLDSDSDSEDDVKCVKLADYTDAVTLLCDEREALTAQYFLLPRYALPSKGTIRSQCTFYRSKLDRLTDKNQRRLLRYLACLKLGIYPPEKAGWRVDLTSDDVPQYYTNVGDAVGDTNKMVFYVDLGRRTASMRMDL